MAISTKAARDLIQSTGDILLHSAADLLASSDFVSRTIGMNNSYEDIMLIVQSLGRQPVSLLGKDYLFIFDHVRRNYQQGTTISSVMYGGDKYWCPKFTFYKEKPTVRFADPYNDPLNLLDRWMPNFTPNVTKSENINKFYAESNDGEVNNKVINHAVSNMGVATGQISSSFQNLATCDLVKKTNENFRHGKYNTLIARFHTNNMDSRDVENPTQTAISRTYGMSHGRNLLKLTPDEPNGYNNPYCRVWTYHHQYNRMLDAIRPFGDAKSAEELESKEKVSDSGVGFRTLESKNYGIDGGSKRLDKHGVLNYDNGFVNIAPTAKIKDYFEHKADDKDRKSVSTKRCMFSIENLAWRDSKSKYDQFEAYGLSAEQRGPLGGRIMWFPPYDINFSENVQVKWNSNEFIGRGENIYTYTNTERRGNLSFTIVIDHPSILDYWTGHERNGMKNKGQTLLPGNTDGVDGKDNQENTLLRFFAGCDILTGKPQDYWMRDKTPANVPEPPAVKDVPQKDPPKPDEAKPVTKTICCVLYYPNNYSGANDKADYAVNYLMNGIGAQKYDNNGTLDDMPIPLDVRPSVYRTLYGGYEVMTPISVALSPIPVSSAAAEQSTYRTENVEEIQYITEHEGTNRYYARYGDNGKEYTLAKIVWNEKLKPDPKKWYKTYSQAGSEYWYFMRWYYRVDNAYTDDRLKEAESYIDSSCYKLNGSGYNKIRTTDMAKKINVPEEGKDSNFHLISFASLFNAVEGSNNKVIVGKECGVNEADVKIVKEILNGEKSGIKIKSIKFRGHASTAGYNNSNITLSDNRRDTFKEWLMDKLPQSEEKKASGLTAIIQDNKSKANYGHANDIDQKIWRSASVMIEYEQSNVENASSKDAEVQTKTENGAVKPVVSDEGYTLDKVDAVSSSPSKKISVQQISSAKDWLYNTDEGTRIRKAGGYVDYVDVVNSNGIKERKPVFKTINPWTFTMKDASKITGKDYVNTAATNYDDSYLNEGISVKKNTVKRYDNEGEFFELLGKENPFMHHLITDKIKYFDPAYHAISPEGFNARLTFLHQCTRQGATIGNSDPNVQTAYNLAFGRPPICVLRIGDFYYTKIVINSMTINYDDPQWDLNPEGIGVMPMFAKINLDFTFIGGSDLAGPIARLQNAVSFNYYANASVYDNRAERVEYDPTGTGKEIRYKPFSYPDELTRSATDDGMLEDI